MQATNKKNSLLILIFFLCLLSGFGIDLYAPSLPAMAQYFHTTSSSVQMALVIYLLGYGIGQLIFGTWSDSCGRKLPLLTSLFFYMLSSILVLFSHSINQVIAIRLLQGISGSAFSALSKALIADSFPENDLAKYSTFLAISWGLGPIIAPFIGGYLQHYFGWQSNFIFQSIQAALLGLLMLSFFKESNLHLVKFNFLNIARTYWQIISHKIFIASVLIIALEYSLAIIFNVQSPFLIQGLLNYSALQYGHIALLVGVGYFLGSMLNRLLVNYFSPSKILNMSIYLGVIVAVSMLFCVELLPVSITLIVIPSLLLFFLGGMISPNCMAKNIALFKESSGSASGITGCLLITGTFISGYIASLLPVKSLLPLSAIYLALTIAYWVINFFYLRDEV